jgi:hypothetical protein
MKEFEADSFVSTRGSNDAVNNMFKPLRFVENPPLFVVY